MNYLKIMRTWLHNANQSNWWRTIKQARGRWAKEDGDQCAAAFAYYLLLSLLPFVFMLVSAASLFVEREVATREVVQWIERYVPLTSDQKSGAMANIRGVLETRGKINLAVFPLLLWGALKFLRTLIRTTNRIWHSPTYKWWQVPLKSLGLLGVALSVALLGILLPGIARLARSWLATYLEFPGWAFALLFNILPWLVLFCGVIMIYRLAPSRPTRFSEVWIGALVATGLIWTCEWFFLVYAGHFAHFNVLYGALGGVAAFLVWIYLSSCVGVFGVCICAAQAEVREKDTLTIHAGGATHE
jgi:YihY family inner membrane protein